MIERIVSWQQPVLKRTLIISSIVVGSFLSSSLFAQDTSEIQQQYPEVADLFNAFDVTQAKALEEIAAINADPATQQARNELQMNMKMRASMTMSELMAAGMMTHDGPMEMGMAGGPHHDLEVAARMRLLDVMRGKYSNDAAETAFENSSAISRHTAEVFKRGRNFEEALFTLYIDDEVDDKLAAVADAIANYLSDDQHSVATAPKQSDYLLSHDQANGLKTAFPLLRGFMWTHQWLQLAALEAVILQGLDSQFNGGVDVALERFWNKVGSSGGMTMFPAPSELPMAPAIAPDLYSQSPEAAIILDNLNLLETVIADILAFPNAENRDELMDQAITYFTGKDTNNAESMDYLLFALRGGIYNQGGPAIGELMQSERNRAREAMNMQHNMIMSSPQ
ncbi:MAG: hypothetical protein COB20_16060 [SAR86 cluster bacterium]|uniref:Uncharacterized protein n=1 Tax=SAR86 cluster bacterium TaxID=2030880 RepID=A0A2A4WUT6_9GAMM|nr:MAG: hypothetical protein COB20_16060 [SAR86 cluster bacterium]